MTTRLEVPVCAAASLGVGALVATLGQQPNLGSTTPVVALVGVVACVAAIVHFGHRTMASVSLSACALTLCLPAVRVTEWMTISDLFLLVAGILLIPDVSHVRLRSSVQRGFALAVVLMLIGGLAGTFAAGDTTLSLLNVARVIVAAGLTLVVFAAWAPSTAELRRLMVLIVTSGCVTALWAISHTSVNFGRPSGLSGHPNHLALVCLIALGPAVAIAAGRVDRAERLVAALAVALLTAAIIASGSRSGLVGLAAVIAAAVVALRDVRSRLRLIGGVAALLAATVLLLGAFTPHNAIDRALGQAGGSVAVSDEGRRAAFDQMIDSIKEHPVTGMGFDDPLDGHDAYLQLWAAGGVAAFVGGLLVVAFNGIALLNVRRLLAGRFISTAVQPLVASSLSLVGVLTALTFQNLLWVRYVWVTVALVAASSAAVDRFAGSGRDVS